LNVLTSTCPFIWQCFTLLGQSSRYPDHLNSVRSRRFFRGQTVASLSLPCTGTSLRLRSPTRLDMIGETRSCYSNCKGKFFLTFGTMKCRSSTFFCNLRLLTTGFGRRICNRKLRRLPIFGSNRFIRLLPWIHVLILLAPSQFSLINALVVKVQRLIRLFCQTDCASLFTQYQFSFLNMPRLFCQIAFSALFFNNRFSLMNYLTGLLCQEYFSPRIIPIQFSRISFQFHLLFVDLH